MGWGLGKLQKEGQRSDRAEEHQEVMGKGEEDVQTRESEQHPGEPVKKSPWRSQTTIIDMMSGGVTTQPLVRQSPNVRLARECVGSPELRLLRRNLLTVTSGMVRDTHTGFCESKPKRN